MKMKRSKIYINMMLIICMVLSTASMRVYAKGSSTVITISTYGSNKTTKSIKISKYVVEIEDGAFSKLKALKKITVDKDNEYFASYEGCLYDKDYTVLMCVPQKIKKVKLRSSVTSYTPHALDGLSQKRKDIIKDYLGVEVVDDSAVKETSEKEDSEDDDYDGIDTDFSQYVYTDEYGQVRFNYTGKGDKRIIVPEGVDIIEGMAEPSWDDANYDVEYIYIPSSVKWIYGEVIFEFVDGDDNWYYTFYRCRNLKKVEVSKDNEDFKTNKKGTVLYNYRGYEKGWQKRWQYNKRIVMGD